MHDLDLISKARNIVSQLESMHLCDAHEIDFKWKIHPGTRMDIKASSRSDIAREMGEDQTLISYPVEIDAAVPRGELQYTHAKLT